MRLAKSACGGFSGFYANKNSKKMLSSDSENGDKNKKKSFLASLHLPTKLQ